MAQRNLTSVLLLSFALVVMPLLRPTVAIGQTVDAASDASQTAAPEPLTDEEMEVLVARSRSIRTSSSLQSSRPPFIRYSSAGAALSREAQVQARYQARCRLEWQRDLASELS